MKLFKYFSSSSPTKIYPLSLFSFLSHASFIQSRYKKKRVCPGLRSSLGRSFCTSTHTFRSHLFSSSSSKTSPKSSSPPWCVVLGERRRERETQRARARRKKEREIQKKTERKTPRTEQKTREETLWHNHSRAWSSETFSSDLIERAPIIARRYQIEQNTPASLLCMRTCVFCSVTVRG